MNVSLSKKMAAGVLALGLSSSLGLGATSAFAATTKSASGTISSVVTKNHELVVKVGKKSDRFKTTPKTIVDLAGKKTTLAKLKAGDRAKVLYTVSGKTLTAMTIAARA